MRPQLTGTKNSKMTPPRMRYGEAGLLVVPGACPSPVGCSAAAAAAAAASAGSTSS